jgi:hypothetical protein
MGIFNFIKNLFSTGQTSADIPMDIQTILQYKFSGAKYSVGEDYESLTWYDDNTVSKPSKQDLQNLWYDVLLTIAKNEKKEAIKNLRAASLGGDLLARVENGNSYYVTTKPEINIFQSAVLVADDITRRWGGYLNGVKVPLVLTKQELKNLSNHYEERKNLAYNLCDDRRAAVDALSTIEEVEAFDINEVII